LKEKLSPFSALKKEAKSSIDTCLAYLSVKLQSAQSKTLTLMVTAERILHVNTIE